MSNTGSPRPGSEDEEELFAAALQRPVSERAAFLDGACHSDAALRARLEALLTAHEQPNKLLEDAALPVQAAGPTRHIGFVEETTDEVIGQKIGRYKLLEGLGEGGCGVVYVAEQTEPVRRRVALKVVKLGMDTKEVIARFEAERQALAMMDHPNIAKVLDAGTTDKGRPYFVMELVRGIRITDYCDQNNLPTRERLDLFIKVCQAIQHAHQKGIIHRDIKPSNILVTLHDGAPVPKVIDFGIAKATEGRLTDATVYTQLHQFIGTPAYMSPEQAEMSGLDIDTRSDIYSLGVLLYELLTGRTPFDAKELISMGLDAMRKAIREKDPLRPSTKLATLQGEELTTTSKRRSVEASKLAKLLRGDLDWVVMKCLEKDRTRRYESASGLAADLKRHLNNEPVAARPPSTAYKFQKAFRRNKLVFTAAAMVLLALLVGIVGTTLGLVRAEKQRRTAEQARKNAEEIAAFLGDIFQNPDPTQERRTVTTPDLLDPNAAPIQEAHVATAADMLNASAKKLETELGAQPRQRAKLQATLGRTYSGLGLYEQAIALQEKVRGYYLATYGFDHPDTLAALYDLAVSYQRNGRAEEAIQLLEQSLPILRRKLGPENPQVASTMSLLGLCYGSAGRRELAIKTSEEALALCRKACGLEHRETLRAMNALANSYFNSYEAGQKREALALREELLPLRRKVLGPEHPETLSAMLNLARSYHRDQRFEEALKLRQDVLTLRRRMVGPEHPDTIGAMDDLAQSYESLGRIDEALKLTEDRLALARKVFGSEHPETLMVLIRLARIYLDAAQMAEGVRRFEEALQLSRKMYGMKGQPTDFATQRLLYAYLRAGRTPDAFRTIDELLALYRKPNDPDRPEPELIANACIIVGRYEDALAPLEQAVRKSPAPITLRNLAALQAWLRKDAGHSATVHILIQHPADFADFRDAMRAAEAICLQPISDAPTREAALAFARKTLEIAAGKRFLSTFWLQTARGMTEYRSGNYAEANTAFDAVAKDVEYVGTLGSRSRTVEFYRAMSLFQQAKTAEAREVFAAAEVEFEKHLADNGAGSRDIVEAVYWLIGGVAHREAKALLGIASTSGQ